jgi:hypothetical protein
MEFFSRLSFIWDLFLQGLLAPPPSDSHRTIHINHEEPLEVPTEYPDNRIVSSKVRKRQMGKMVAIEVGMFVDGGGCYDIASAFSTS